MVKRDGELVKTVHLNYDGEPSKFALELEVAQPGSYEVIAYGYDPETGNSGVDRRTFMVRK